MLVGTGLDLSALTDGIVDDHAVLRLSFIVGQDGGQGMRHATPRPSGGAPGVSKFR